MTDTKPSSFFFAAMKLIGITLALGVFYFAAWPWIARLLIASSDVFTDVNHPLCTALELSLYPATRLALSFELYEQYFWVVLLEPLVG